MSSVSIPQKARKGNPSLDSPPDKNTARILALIVGQPEDAHPLTAAQRAALDSLTPEQWPSVAPVYNAALDRARREAVAGISPESARGVGEAMTRFAESAWRDSDRRRIIEGVLSQDALTQDVSSEEATHV